MALNPLGKVKELVESVGMAISYAYDDLVFLEHNAFLLQFGEDGTLIVHTNEEAAPGEVNESFVRLQDAAPLHQLIIVKGKIYSLSEADDNTVKLAFY